LQNIVAATGNLGDYGTAAPIDSLNGSWKNEITGLVNTYSQLTGIYLPGVGNTNLTHHTLNTENK
jgi:hypothetical protein